MMRDEQFLEILKRHRKGQASAEEQEFLRTYYNLFELEPNVLDHVVAEEKQGIKDRIENKLMAAVSQRNKPVKLWPRIASVAAAVAAVVFGIWFYMSYMNTRHSGEGQNSGSVAYVNDIAPGKNTATLTLASGKVIDLSDAKTGVIISASSLKYNDNSNVDINGRHPEIVSGTRTGKASMLTASTPRGGTYTVTLPDGTKVWLNAASSLTFPSHFANVTTRRVELSGEAYFEVFKNKKQPFVVNSKKLEVTVLGTHFNVNTYEDEGSSKTTLLEGSVRVANSKQTVVLKPDQQATLIDHTLQVKEVDANDVIAWKEGKFSFSSEELGSIMRKVARWYNVEVVFADALQKERVTGSVSRFANVSKLLQKLEQAGGMHFKIEGKKITVTK